MEGSCDDSAFGILGSSTRPRMLYVTHSIVRLHVHIYTTILHTQTHTYTNVKYNKEQQKLWVHVSFFLTMSVIVKQLAKDAVQLNSCLQRFLIRRNKVLLSLLLSTYI